MTGPERLARFEAIIDASGIASGLEEILPLGVRRRQLSVRTLVVGIMVTLTDGRPAHLSRVHKALVSLSALDQDRLGVVVEWRSGRHLLTYRQVERTLQLVVGALALQHRDGEPSALLQEVVEALVEASIPAEVKEASTSLAVDWTDVESFSTRRTKADGHYADEEASWGHRKGGGPGEKDELFFGYYLQLATMVSDDGGPAVPELVRAMLLTSCHVDPPAAVVKVIEHMVDAGIVLGDVLCDSGYAHRVAERWAWPLRAVGANLVMDLHPHDRGTQGTHQGAIAWNGNLYCPSTPKALFDLEPLSRQASSEQTEAHDHTSTELSRYKLGRIAGPDNDGYQRVQCPAVMGKVRCPWREDSMTLPYDRPEILSPPEHPPACCNQVTITVPPTVNAKTAQRHDYPSKAHRRSYARRTAAERSNSTIKDPATNDIARGWCRTMGLVPMTFMLACLMVVRNERVLEAFARRQAEDQRRLAAGLPAKTRRRRRRTINDLLATANAPP